MRKIAKTLLLSGSFFALFLVAGARTTGVGLVFLPPAEALVGVPLSPVSFAGVARRTTRRAVIAGSSVAAYQQQAVAEQQAAGSPPVGSVVSTLPAGCVSSPKGGVQYFNCNGVYYRAAFQGNNLVYAVAQP